MTLITVGIVLAFVLWLLRLPMERLSKFIVNEDLIRDRLTLIYSFY